MVARTLTLIAIFAIITACSGHHESGQGPLPTVQPAPCCHEVQCEDFSGHNPRLKTFCLDSEIPAGVCFVGDACFYQCPRRPWTRF